jgi:hypothetical protein
MTTNSKCPRCSSPASLSYSLGLNRLSCGKCESSWRISTAVVLGWVAFRMAFGALAALALGLRGALLIIGIYVATIPLDALFETFICYFPSTFMRRDNIERLSSEVGVLSLIDPPDRGTWKRIGLLVLGAGLFFLLPDIQKPMLRDGILFLLLFVLNDGETMLQLARHGAAFRSSAAKTTV